MERAKILTTAPEPYDSPRRVVTAISSKPVPAPIVIFNDHSVLSYLTIYLLWHYICFTHIDFHPITSNAISIDLAVELEQNRKRGHKLYCIGCTLNASLEIRAGVDVVVDDHNTADEKNMFDQLVDILTNIMNPRKKCPDFEHIQKYAGIAFRVENGTASPNDLALYTSLYMALRTDMRNKKFIAAFGTISAYMRTTAKNPESCARFGNAQVTDALKKRCPKSRTVHVLKSGATVILYQNVKLGSFHHVIMETEGDFVVFIGRNTIIVQSKHDGVNIKAEFCDNGFYHGYPRIMYISHDNDSDRLLPEILQILSNIAK